MLITFVAASFGHANHAHGAAAFVAAAWSWVRTAATHARLMLAVFTGQSLALIWAMRAVLAGPGPEGPGPQLAAREAERQRIARDLHDELGQLLSLLRQRAALLLPRLDAGEPKRSVQELLMLADLSLRSLRELIFDLRPSALDKGLGPALERLATGHNRHSGLACSCSISGCAALGDEQALQLYRIAQEALGNVFQHAGASAVQLALDCDGRWLRLLVQDDGCGFQLPASSSGQGLHTMRERADLIGAELLLSSQPGLGTRVEVWLPMPGCQTGNAPCGS